VVAPFRVAGADPALAYLREGLLDLLVTKLTDEDGPRAVDPGAVMSAWREAGLGNRTDVPRSEALGVAGRLGATRLLTGSVVGAPNRLVVNATLLGLPGGDLRAQASADGPADSLTSIVDRLAARLLATEAGVWDRLASHTSSSVEALRAYLDGQAAYRRASYRDAIRHLRRALESDPSFAMAGLGLAQAADRIDDQYERARGLAAAWTGRGELTERDSVYLEALAGPRYPAESPPREQLAAWERAAAVIPDPADVWHELGERLFYDGRLLGLGAWERRAAAAFRRAADLDPAFASPLQYLTQLAATSGDTAAVRAAAAAYHRLDSTGELAPFVRWRAAISLGGDADLRDLRRRFASIPSASLRAILLSSQFNGIALEDAERALAILTSRAARGAERADLLLARHALARNRGKIGLARTAIDALLEDRSQTRAAHRLRLIDQMAAGPDSVVAAADADVLASRPAGDECPALCGALVEAIEGLRNRAPDAAQLVRRADSLLLSDPAPEEVRAYASLALTRMYRALGDQARALVVVRRRPHMRPWPHNLAAHLRLEGLLAARAHDSAGAAAAFRHYLALRAAPDGDLRAEAAAVRAELARLTTQSPSARE
jgi:hypothetical protein